MKREPRQHGMLRTYPVIPSAWYLKPKIRIVQKLESFPIVELFFDVPSKPSNHSKITGKCDRPQCLECHLNPVNKSKNKIKGTQKFRTSNMNMMVNPRLITWRVVDQPGLNFFGFSASSILQHLYSANEEDEVDDHVDDHHDDYDTCATFTIVNDDDDDFMANFWSLRGKEIEEHVDDGDKDDDDDDFMANFWSLYEKEIEEYVDDGDKDNDDDDDFMANFWSLHEKHVDNDNKVDSDYDYDDAMSFCDDGFMSCYTKVMTMKIGIY